MSTSTWRAVLVTVLILVGASTASRLAADDWRPLANALSGLEAWPAAFGDATDLALMALAGVLTLWLGVRLSRRRPAAAAARPVPARRPPAAPAMAVAPRGRLAVRARETGHSQDALRLLALRGQVPPADPEGRNCRGGSNGRTAAPPGRPLPTGKVVAASAVAARLPAAVRTAYRLPRGTSV